MKQRMVLNSICVCCLYPISFNELWSRVLGVRSVFDSFLYINYE